MTHHEVERWTARQSVVQVAHCESTTIGDVVRRGKILRLADRDIRCVDAVNGETTQCKPHRTSTATTSNIQRSALSREKIDKANKP